VEDNIGAIPISNTKEIEISVEEVIESLYN